MKMSTRSIVITGMLGAIAIVLGASGMGIIPVPTPAGKATIMHVPAILGGIIEGPLVGAMVGLIFGLFSFLNATTPMAADPIVAIIPRIFIGVVSYYVFVLFQRHTVWGAGAAALAGTLTNAVGFLGLSVVQGYLKWKAVLVILFTNTLGEIIVAIMIVVALTKALERYMFKGTKS